MLVHFILVWCVGRGGGEEEGVCIRRFLLTKHRLCLYGATKARDLAHVTVPLVPYRVQLRDSTAYSKIAACSCGEETRGRAYATHCKKNTHSLHTAPPPPPPPRPPLPPPRLHREDEGRLNIKRRGESAGLVIRRCNMPHTAYLQQALLRQY